MLIIYNILKVIYVTNLFYGYACLFTTICWLCLIQISYYLILYLLNKYIIIII
jgi:hypothetical protein